MRSIELEPIRRNTLTTLEVAEYLGVSKETIYGLVRSKEIVHFRIGSRILFKRDAIDQWIDNKMITGLDENE